MHVPLQLEITFSKGVAIGAEESPNPISSVMLLYSM